LFPFSVRAAKAATAAELAAASDLASSARKPHVPKGLSSTHFPIFGVEPKVLATKGLLVVRRSSTPSAWSMSSSSTSPLPQQRLNRSAVALPLRRCRQEPGVLCRSLDFIIYQSQSQVQVRRNKAAPIHRDTSFRTHAVPMFCCFRCCDFPGFLAARSAA